MIRTGLRFATDGISESSVAVPWDTSSLDGQIYVRAGAQDIAGNTGRSETVPYRLDNAAARPIVSIIKPEGGTIPISRDLIIIGTVNVGIAEDAIIEEVLLEYRNLSDDARVWNEIPSLAARGRRFNSEEIARWNTEEVPDGEYRLRLTAIDSYGYESETIRSFILDNTHPEVSITSPQEGAVLPAGNIHVSGIAVDNQFLRYELKVLHDENEEVIRTVSTAGRRWTARAVECWPIWKAITHSGSPCETKPDSTPPWKSTLFLMQATSLLESTRPSRVNLWKRRCKSQVPWQGRKLQPL